MAEPPDLGRIGSCPAAPAGRVQRSLGTAALCGDEGSTFRSNFAEISVFFSFSLVTGKRNFGIFRFQI